MYNDLWDPTPPSLPCTITAALYSLSKYFRSVRLHQGLSAFHHSVGSRQPHGGRAASCAYKLVWPTTSLREEAASPRWRSDCGRRCTLPSNRYVCQYYLGIYIGRGGCLTNPDRPNDRPTDRHLPTKTIVTARTYLSTCHTVRKEMRRGCRSYSVSCLQLLLPLRNRH